MYRIFCESYRNYLKSFDEDNYRLKISKPIGLMADMDRYKEEEENQSELYKKVCDLVFYMKQNVNKFPKLKAFLWTLSSRDIKENPYNISKVEELEEQTKLINSFLKLAYWY